MNKLANTTNFRQSLGRMGETIAREFLITNGWTILECNYRAHRLGEIDIIGRPPQSSILAFVEVKTRDIKTGAGAFEHTGLLSVPGGKAGRMIQTAMTYVRLHPTGGAAMRFDLILVDINLNRRDLNELIRLNDVEALRMRARLTHMEAIAGAF
jgi:putative endonuclease